MLLDLLVQLDRLDQNWCYRNIQSGATAACLLNASGSLGPIEFEGNSRGVFMRSSYSLGRSSRELAGEGPAN